MSLILQHHLWFGLGHGSRPAWGNVKLVRFKHGLEHSKLFEKHYFWFYLFFWPTLVADKSSGHLQWCYPTLHGLCDTRHLMKAHPLHSFRKSWSNWRHSWMATTSIPSTQIWGSLWTLDKVMGTWKTPWSNFWKLEGQLWKLGQIRRQSMKWSPPWLEGRRADRSCMTVAEVFAKTTMEWRVHLLIRY